MSIINPGNGQGEIVYNISTNPSSLSIYQNNDILQSASITINTYQSDLDFDPHEYRLNLFCSTENFGYDIFELESDSIITLGSSSAYSGTAVVKIKSLENLGNATYNGFLFISISKRLNNSPWYMVSDKQIPLTASINLPTTYNFSLNKNSDAIHFTRSTNTSTVSNLNVISDIDYIVTGPSYIKVNGNSLPLTLNGNKALQITATDSNELLYGNNQANLVFKKANLVLANFLLNVNLTNTNQLEVSVNTLSYSLLSNATTSPAQRIQIYVPSGNPTFTKPAWLSLELVSAANNVFIYDAKAIATGLDDGNYNDTLTIKNGSNSIDVSLSLEIYGYWNEEYNQSLHFTLDQDLLKFYPFKRDENNYININLSAIIYDNQNKQRSINESLNFYFSDNNTTFNLGKYMHDYFEIYEAQINDLDVTSHVIQHRKMYELARVDLAVTEKNYTNQQTVFWYNIPTQLFLKGHRPNTLTNENIGFLGNNINKTSRATIKGKTILNYLHNGMNPVKVFVNGTLQEVSIPKVQNARLSIFSLYIDFQQLNLEIGDLVEFLIGTQVVRYVIFPETNQSNFIAYIDYWGLLKIFEVTGEFTFSYKNSYVNYVPKKGHLKNVDATRNNSLQVNTGIITQDDTISITEILTSSKCWFIQGEKITEIIPTTEEVAYYDSEDELFAYELEFHINPTNYDHNYGS